MNPQTRFDRHPVAAKFALATVVIAIGLLSTEIALRVIGLGDPVLYEVHPDYGYRPRPNQLVRRFGGAVVRLNNLGIRANENWDTGANKVLFVGDSVTYGGSYVSNSDLFALLAVPKSHGWVGGSAGVNAWGIENMHGLIVRHAFFPARVYVTVLIETDFYRGFSERPDFFWTAKPFLALHEIIPHVASQVKALLHREMPPASAKTAAEAQKTNRDTVQRAVNRLTELDAFLRVRGFQHLIYISPSRANLEHNTPPDPLVASTLDLAPIRVQRLQNRLESMRLDATGIASLYHDGVHLSRRGHQVWASVMKSDVEAAIATANRQTGLGLLHVRFCRAPNFKTFPGSLAWFSRSFIQQVGSVGKNPAVIKIPKAANKNSTDMPPVKEIRTHLGVFF